MAFFNNKNPNEAAYIGGKKNWADVIKNSGSGEFLIWRQPEEDFNTNSTLIVMPGEEAIFISSGTVEQVFDNGTYKLSTNNYPFISRLRNAFTGGVSTFNCVVYFVRKAHSEEILWGTDSPVQVRDKILGIATKIKARGAYKIQVDNAAKFLEKLIGNNVFLLRQDEIPKYFRNEFQSKIKSSIARGLIDSDLELLGIDARLNEFADFIKPHLQEVFNEYGIRLVEFSVAACDITDDEIRRKYDEIGMQAIERARLSQAEAIAKQNLAHADKSVMGILGDDWVRQQAVNIMTNISNNPGSGGLAAEGAGLGMGLAAGSALGSIAGQVFSNSSETQNNNPLDKIKQLKELFDMGAITQEEYDAKKKEILARM
jgi:membrane protease subunit (stomatin/prohibitin family)